VKFYDENGVLLKTQQVAAGENAVPPNISRAHATLVWGSDYENVTNNVDAYASFIEVDRYTVAFNNNDDISGNEPLSQQVYEGEYATPPDDDPTRDGYTFLNWSYDFSNPIMHNMTIIAQWKENTQTQDPSTPVGDINFGTSVHNINIDSAAGGAAGAIGNAFIDITLHPPSDFSQFSSLYANKFLVPTLTELSAQNNNLINGYDKVAEKYSNPIFAALSSAESGYRAAMLSTTSVKDYATQMAGGVDAVLDAIFGNSSADRTAFDNDLAAYQKGHYYAQKQIDRGVDRAAFESALAGVGLTSMIERGVSSGSEIVNDTTPISNMAAILSTLETRLLEKLNTKMGVSSMTNTNKGIVERLNKNLIAQIGEDMYEFSAKGKDAEDAGFPSISDGMYWSELGITQTSTD
jgi:hypothetical protein